MNSSIPKYKCVICGFGSDISKTYSEHFNFRLHKDAVLEGKNEK